VPATAARTQLWLLNTLVTLRIGSEQGSDGLSVLETLAPRGASPPLHVHHTEDEIFHILEGELRFRVGDEELRVGAGETLLAPKRVPHTYLVESERGRWLVATAHGDFERFVRSFSRPAERAELPEPSPPPTPEQAEAMAAACRQHGIELVGPPLD
jgi:mannose-6-phosphate isomerase-like protein (cupin superfamily)